MHQAEGYRAATRMIASALVSLIVIAATAPTAVATPLKCRRTISKASAVFVQNELKASQRCEDTILRGKFAGPCPNQKATAKIVKLRAKLATVIAAACGGRDKVCGLGNDDELLPSIGWTMGICPDIAESGCNATIDDCTGAGSCVRCVDEAATAATIDLAFDDFVLNTPDPAVRKCQRVIGKESAQFVGLQLKALQGCEDRVLRGKAAGPCPDGIASVRLAKSQTKMQQKICKACGGPNRACGGGDDLSPTQIGSALSCPDVAIPGGTACGGAIGTLSELITCLDCVGRHRAVCMDRLAAPGITTYPAECNQTGSNATATATPTPTSTPTTTPGGGPTATTTPAGPTATATPSATATDTPTPTPTATATQITLRIDLSTALLTTVLDLDVAYPTLKGGFDGSGPAVDCDGPGGLAIFAPSDDDNGLLDLDLSLLAGLSFPLSIECRFTVLPGEVVTTADFTITVDDFLGLLGAILDPLQLGITPQVLP